MSLTPHDIARMLDHSTLQPFLTEDDIRRGCELALKYNTASVCARPCDVPILAEMLRGSDVKVCTVIGFPLGAMSTAGKAAETEAAVSDGANELDMVINVGWLLAGEDDLVRRDIEAVVAAAQGRCVKVIIEACLLTDEEKVKACELSVEAGATFVKTSTGFSIGGATVADVALMRKTVGDKCKVKAAGGIHTAEEAKAMVEAGADRLGCSAGVQIMSGC